MGTFASTSQMAGKSFDDTWTWNMIEPLTSSVSARPTLISFPVTACHPLTDPVTLLSAMPFILGFSTPSCRSIMLPRKVTRRARLLDKPQSRGFAGEPKFLLTQSLCLREPLKVNDYQLWLGFRLAIRAALMGRHVTHTPMSRDFLGKPWRRREAEPAASVTLWFHATEPPLGPC